MTKDRCKKCKRLIIEPDYFVEPMLCDRCAGEQKKEE